MKKKIVIVLAIISIAILVIGISAGSGVTHQLKSEGEITQPIYMDGTDFTDVAKGFVEIGSWLLGFVIVIYSIGIIAAIWIIYGIVILVIHIVNRKKNKTKEV